MIHALFAYRPRQVGIDVLVTVFVNRPPHRVRCGEFCVRLDEWRAFQKCAGAAGHEILDQIPEPAGARA